MVNHIIRMEDLRDFMWEGLSKNKRYSDSKYTK